MLEIYTKPIILVIISVTLLQIFINYVLHYDISISPHVLIRNIIIICIIYLYYSSKNIQIIIYGCGLVILLEIIIQTAILTSPITVFDERLSRVKNYYKWHDLTLEQVTKFKNNPERFSATEGYYYDKNGNIDLKKTVTDAQTDKNLILLDKLNVTEGTRIIDLGCGYGNLLLEAKKRGAICYGVSICKHHIDFIKTQYDISGIVADFKNLPKELHGKFDCVVANGSLEHLGFIEDVNNNTLNKTYENFFNGVSNLIDNTSENRQVFITCLHKNDERGKQWSMWDFFNAYLIQMTYGGFYPSSPSGLTKNMKDFTITSQVDATIHYELTSRTGIDGSDYDFGSRFIRNTRLSSLLLQFLSFLNDPYYIQKELYYIFNSWRWQFENKNCIHYWIIGRKYIPIT
jgi:cyclopropane fatty-acyl-phospholipid synthase-like methyltransferase